jgi:RimJ/RimL family protein N-acetyltransferase
MLRISNPEDRLKVATAAGVSVVPTDPVIVRVEENIVLGGFLFSQFTGKGGSIWAHAAGFQPGWIDRPLLRFAFEYVFLQLDCRAVFARIAEDNKASLDFNAKLGFNRVGYLEHVYPDGRGQVITQMLPHECRWLSANVRLAAGRTIH